LSYSYGSLVNILHFRLSDHDLGPSWGIAFKKRTTSPENQ
jgi:hypothetical protein